MLGTTGAGASRTLAILCNPEVCASQVSEIVGKEPALCARVLRVANSSYYGQSRSVPTIERAIVILGLEAVRGIAAAASLDRVIPQGREFSLIDTGALIHHSLATAAAAQAIAQVHDPVLTSQAFIAGLLHNVGIFVQFYIDRPGVTSIISERLSDPIRDMRILEDERSIVSHAECAAVIFEGWQLPDSLVAATRYHHNPMSAPEPYRRLAAVVNLGANVALAQGHTFPLEPAAVALNLAAMESLGLEDGHLDAIAGAISGRLVALRGVSDGSEAGEAKR